MPTAVAMASEPKRPPTRTGSGSRPPTSRFQEGSMNDRTSAAPPPQFMGPDQIKAYEDLFFSSPPPTIPEARKRRPLSAAGQLQASTPGQHIMAGHDDDTDHAHSVMHKKSMGSFFGRVRNAIFSKGQAGQGQGGGHPQQQHDGRNKHSSLQEPMHHHSHDEEVPQPLKPIMSMPPPPRSQYMQGGRSQSEINIPQLFPATGGGGASGMVDRPSREEVMASYNQLVASGFFQSHAIQSTRHARPPMVAGVAARNGSGSQSQIGSMDPPPRGPLSPLAARQQREQQPPPQPGPRTSSLSSILSSRKSKPRPSPSPSPNPRSRRSREYGSAKRGTIAVVTGTTATTTKRPSLSSLFTSSIPDLHKKDSRYTLRGRKRTRGDGDLTPEPSSSTAGTGTGPTSYFAVPLKRVAKKLREMPSSSSSASSSSRQSASQEEEKPEAEAEMTCDSTRTSTSTIRPVLHYGKTMMPKTTTTIKKSTTRLKKTAMDGIVRIVPPSSHGDNDNNTVNNYNNYLNNTPIITTSPSRSVSPHPAVANKINNSTATLTPVAVATTATPGRSSLAVERTQVPVPPQTHDRTSFAARASRRPRRTFSYTLTQSVRSRSRVAERERERELKQRQQQGESHDGEMDVDMIDVEMGDMRPAAATAYHSANSRYQSSTSAITTTKNHNNNHINNHSHRGPLGTWQRATVEAATLIHRGSGESTRSSTSQTVQEAQQPRGRGQTTPTSTQTPTSTNKSSSRMRTQSPDSKARRSRLTTPSPLSAMAAGGANNRGPSHIQSPTRTANYNPNSNADPTTPTPARATTTPATTGTAGVVVVPSALKSPERWHGSGKAYHLRDRGTRAAGGNGGNGGIMSMSVPFLAPRASSPPRFSEDSGTAVGNFYCIGKENKWRRVGSGSSNSSGGSSDIAAANAGNYGHGHGGNGMVVDSDGDIDLLYHQNSHGHDSNGRRSREEPYRLRHSQWRIGNAL